MAVDKNTFQTAVGLIVDNLEGGYFHPNMLSDGRVNDSRYSTSGETMFGIDRARGGTINDSDAGRQFWQIIDDADAKNKWKWNYKGGDLAGKLKSLAADMMYPEYAAYSEKYLSPQSRAIIDKSPKLTFNFAYATWNGPGWFKAFASDFNKAVDSGITDPKKLEQVALQSRLNPTGDWSSAAVSLIAQGGKKIATLFESAAFAGLDVLKKNKGKFIVGILAVTIIIGAVIYYNENKTA